MLLRRHSIVQYLLLLALAAMIPFLGLIAFNIYARVHENAEEARARVLRLARAAAFETEEFLARRHRLLLQVAERPLVRALDAAGCDPILGDFARVFPQTANLLTVDATGALVCSAVPPAQGAPRAVDPALYLNEVRRTRAFVIGKPNRGFVTGRWVVSLAEPILDKDNELRGIVLLAIDLLKMSESRNDQGLPPSTVAAIIDADGKFITRSGEPAKWVGEHAPYLDELRRSTGGSSGAGRAMGVDGVERYFGLQRIAGTGWTAVVGTSMSGLYADAERNAKISVAVALCAMLLAAVLCVVAARRIVRPVAAIADGARRAGAGDNSVRVEPSGPEETARVATEFNHMLELRAAADAELRQVNRTLTVLSHCNQVLVRATSEQQLLDEMCRLLVEQGGYALAWIGFAEPDGVKRVRPAASAGATGYLEGLDISWGDDELGRGPVGTAVRSAQPIFTRDIAVDPNYGPWRDRAARFGFRSSIGVPIGEEKPAFGLLSLYSTNPNRFGEEEIRLLAELANDLSYGIRSLRADAQRKEAEHRLRESAARLEVHARRQERLARFGQFALMRHGRDELIREAVLQLGGLVDVAVLFEEAPDGGLVLREGCGEGTAPTVGQSVPVDPVSAAKRVLEGAQTVKVDANYCATCPEHWPWSAWMRGMKSGAFVPVTQDGQAHGMLAIFSRSPDAVGDEEAHFAEAVGHVLSSALQREQAEQRLAFLAQFDALTGLPNRSLLEDRLGQIMVRSARGHRSAGVLFVDLDRFKLVNDSLGHQAGDALIREVARRFERSVRPGDTVGRISGDEFAIALADLDRAEDAGIVAQKILDALEQPFDLAGSEAFVGASIGISVYPNDGEDVATLLRNADMAMYKVKTSTRNAYGYYAATMNEGTAAKLQLNTDLRRALERREFMLHYQPKIDLRSGALTGMEALLRWNHPQRGLVSPAEFIPALEWSGLILAVGEWVLEEACAQLRRWQLAGLRPVPVAVNLSQKQFRRRDLDQAIRGVLEASGVAPGLVELEITESSIADDPEDAVRQMQNLRAAGLSISLDDFGTGYSSLAYLTRLPLSALKIDRSFVRDASDRPDAASIVRAIIDMAHNLNFTVVAEGVETEWQAQFLRLYKCDQAQGYLYGRPVAAAEIEGRLPRVEPT